MRKKPTTFLLAASVALALGSVHSPGLAEEQSSLIESALDGKLDSSFEIPANAEAKSVDEPQKSSQKKQKNDSAVTFAPQRARDSEDTIPPPTNVMAPAIHSLLPASQKSILRMPLGVKVGKSFAVDPTYRGKPALQKVPTVSFGTPSWAIPPKKQIAGVPVTPISIPAQGKTPPAPATVAPQSSSAENSSQAPATVNVRLLSPTNGYRPTDCVWAYPYPPKLPKQVPLTPLPEDEAPLKQMILNFGYSMRPDKTQPYPSGGWRWLHAFETARKKADMGYPHTMLTMYPWVNKIFPYVHAECVEMNKVEERRTQRYEQLAADYERLHTDLESQATTRNLTPIEIKVNFRGIGQYQLPPGHWWIAATRKTPGLKFYWQTPISCSSGQTVNVQLNESSALIIAGSW